MHRVVSLLTLAALAACSSPAAPSARLNEEFTLAVGERADVNAAGMALRFIRVVTDSRCPTNVECIWAGNAQIALEVTRGSARDTVALNTLDGPQEVVVAGQYRVRLVSLAPAPLDPGPIEPDAYRARLLVVAVNGQVCTAEVRPALTVSIVDSLTGAGEFTNVRIIARDGEFADTVSRETVPGPSAGSTLALAYERAGTYEVTVTADGYQPWVRAGVRVDRDPCHVVTVPLVARLSR